MIDLSIIQQLHQYSLFAGLEQAQIVAIASLMEEELFEAGADIIVEGSYNGKIRLIIDGKVSVSKKGIILMQIGEGAIFGEIEIVDVEPAEATVTAMSATKVLSLSIDALCKIYDDDLKAYSFILMNLARYISRRLRHMDSVAVKESPLMEWS